MHVLHLCGEHHLASEIKKATVWVSCLCSGHKQIRLPSVGNRAHEALHEHDVAWADGSPQKLHASLFGRSVCFFVVALGACRNQVFPRVAAALRFWNDVVNGQGQVGAPAVLTAVAVAPQDVAPSEHDFLVWHGDEDHQPHHAGHWKV